METATLDPAVETDPTPMPHDPPADGTGDPNAPDPPGADNPTEPDEQTGRGEPEPIKGHRDHLTTDSGGKTPTSAKFQILGKTQEIEGEFDRGQIIRATIELRVGGMHFDDKHDSSTGQVVACTRKHRAEIIGFALQP